MRTINLLSAALTLLTLAACSRGTAPAVEGTANPGDIVHLDDDSTTVAGNGHFQIKADIQDEPTFHNLSTPNFDCTILLDSAETLTCDLTQAKPAFPNSPANTQLLQLSESAKQLATNITHDNLLRHKQLAQDIILANPRSMVAYFALFQTVNSLAIFDPADPADMRLFGAAATSLQLAYPRSRQVQTLCATVLRQRAADRQKAKMDTLMRQAQIAGCPDFALPDINGDTIRLSQLQGLPTLLAFWLSSDQTCRQVNRHLGIMHGRYGQRLNIVSVSFDTSRVLWESASKADGVNWTNLCDLRGAESLPAVLYNVQRVPANYLIDKNGNLIGKDLFDRRLEERLAELLR